ncbi:MAG TPA: hypothetical protein VF226_02820 [Hyphomicrobiaceae bacterium]
MAETVTQFAARVLGIADCPPPQPKRGPQYGTGAVCWLCGGATDGKGWPQATAIAPTFTQHNTAKANDSDAVCQSCAALTRAETFQRMVAERGLSVKTWTQAGWHSYSHFIRDDGHYSVPSRKDMRALLLDPPPGRWLLCINTTGQKHTIFRATVASSRTLFPVQMDETTIWCRADEIRQCMADFEGLCALGFSKDSILTGQYHPAQLLKAGLSRWKPAEGRIAPWRQSHPDLMALVHFVALGPAEFEPIEAAEYERSAVPPQRQAQGQMEMF